MPTRGFPTSEFETRTSRAQQAMRNVQLDALLVTTEPEIRYFTGFQTQFFESPTRPWFLIVPADGKPIAVIPTIGEAGMAATWIDEIKTWPSTHTRRRRHLAAGDDSKFPTEPLRQTRLPLGQECVLRMPVRDTRVLGTKYHSNWSIVHS
ncbi:MAG: hypothetical protein CM1200mP18_22190 [Gammaproteobacteria bacterium]|nr:MAG: hypothetical protein CM1200mP18_22190 [Gammaproteobacteria bacterium]